MKRAVFVSGVLLLLAPQVTACGEPERSPSGPSVGTNSNWLRACAEDAQCTDELTACTCGACTVTCANDDDCSELADARCAVAADPAALAACGEDASGSGICLPRCAPGSCDPGQACIDGACVLAPLPDNAFCAAVAERDDAARAREEELLALLQAERIGGGAQCGSAAPTSPAPALRFDPRLVCAARVFADDIARTRAPGAVDSQGRNTEDRMREADYVPRLWGDGFAIAAATPEQGRDLILRDAGNCMRLADPAFADIGVGSAGDVLVMTIGAE